MENGLEGEHLTGRPTNEAIKFVEQNKINPFVLYLPFYSVHTRVRGNPTWTQSGNPVDLEPKDITIAYELKRAGYVNGIIEKRDLYEGGIRVPFIAKWTDKIE